jgi:hypothetical protein
MTGNLRDFGPRSERARRDPSGKRAIFSASSEDSAPGSPPGVAATPEIDRPERPVSNDPARPGTLVVECSSCGERTRVTYFDFALLNLPLGFYVPIPGRRFKHRMTCPACSRWTWVGARWLE